MDDDERSSRRYDLDLIRRSGTEWRELQSRVNDTRQEVRELSRELFGRPGMDGAIQRLEKKVDTVSANVATQIANAATQRTARLSGETVRFLLGIAAIIIAGVVLYFLTRAPA